VIRNPEVEISEDLLDELKKVSVPTATASLMVRGFQNTYPIGVNPAAVRPGQVMVGRARTLRFVALREDLVKTQYDTVEGRPHRQAIEFITPGEILVIDTGGCVGAGVVGDMFTRRVQARGGTGIVIDGVVRDLVAIQEVGLPVFCRGAHGAGINRMLMSVGVNEPVQVGGVPVLPGDVLLGDPDGLVVIPPQEVEYLVEHGVEHDLQEKFTRIKLGEGYPLHRAYPPDEELKKEYEVWKKTQ
jgi:5-oxopent-3-ene-1,2,5-tricarboxylate decarboxylase/2-hydroxyhepta-2,4-diene-1,7-dioate isomerase